MRTASRALIATVVLAVFTGLVYPLVATGFAQVVLRGHADGSLIDVAGRPVGSSLIGQDWKGPNWFYGRPSAIEYDASTSSGSNLGPHSRELADEIGKRVAAILKLESPYSSGITASDIPADLVTASASGLDPDISPAAAAFQAPRIASVRGVSTTQVLALIQSHTAGRTLGFLGQPHVNVLELNLALDRLSP
ncbi:MAG: potassium-transporting ATPase subunit KdpC [Actinomycetota bacterium]|nr:potassium-transporting ATPase subunit KdpC [Actinomycetota bacterium]